MNRGFRTRLRWQQARLPCPARARLGPKTLTSRAHTWAHSAQVVPSSGAWSVVSVLDVHRTTHPLLSFLSSDPRFIIMNPRLCRQASPGTGEKARGDTKSLSEDQRITVHPKPRTLGAFAPQGGVRCSFWSQPVHLSPRWGDLPLSGCRRTAQPASPFPKILASRKPTSARKRPPHQSVLSLHPSLTSTSRFLPPNSNTSQPTPAVHLNEPRVLHAVSLATGKIALSGESKSLSEDPRIKKAYLGA